MELRVREGKSCFLLVVSVLRLGTPGLGVNLRGYFELLLGGSFECGNVDHNAVLNPSSMVT